MVFTGLYFAAEQGDRSGSHGGKRRADSLAAVAPRSAHVVASDAHSAHRRNPDLSTVRDVIGQDLSWRYAEILLEENPYLIFQNERIVPTGSG